MKTIHEVKQDGQSNQKYEYLYANLERMHKGKSFLFLITLDVRGSFFDHATQTQSIDNNVRTSARQSGILNDDAFNDISNIFATVSHRLKDLVNRLELDQITNIRFITE